MSCLDHIVTKSKSLLYKDSLLGILLISLTILVMIVANIPFSSSYYFNYLNLKIADLTLKHWVNDILMVSYFFMIGLDIKHELINGELSSWKKRSLPALGAIGGIIFPALIYLFINRHTEFTLRGWAIPTATDIAFTLGMLSLMGPRFPPSLKIFFTALTIIDDFSAVAIIAFFYTQHLHLYALIIATTLIFLLFALNRFRVTHLFLYGFFGLCLWYAILISGIHTTVFGVIFALLLPDTKTYATHTNKMSFYFLGDGLKLWVNYLILPAFVLVNAGFSLSMIPYIDLCDSIVWGTTLGLFLGKQIGIFLFSFIAIKFGWGILPKNSSWRLLYGGSILCGIGFTMSMFLTLQAFPNSSDLQEKAKLGIILASIMSGILAYFILKPSQNK
ncbi:MAG: Na+/H+ antiporter NhaA [Candidatus Liberibacter ctenarytainae]|uniref:Na(+)/H(+) antiporter NhaA n=1 Tax=Candidatus Liberibacter ctenarytainae TaxID=2020335 RepID=A0A937AJ05_9HYPH|nr:Na+/H+ antiporter NhaA [Candidatus Liberibacter ctenarytainae]